MWGALLRGAFYFASTLGLGATLERWFSPGTENPENDPLGFAKYLRLILIGGIIYILFKIFGRKLPR